MRPSHLALSLSLMILAAGCLGAKEDPEVAAVDAASTGSGAAAGAGASAAPDGTAAAGAEGAAAGNASAPPLPDAPFSYSGSTPEGVCGPAGCQFASQGAEDFHPVEHAGAPTSITVTYTYADVPPGMEFYVGICFGEGEDESAVSCEGYTTGASPLTVTFPLPGTAGGQIALSTGALSTAAAPAGVMVFGPSTFDASGVLSYA